MKNLFLIVIFMLGIQTTYADQSDIQWFTTPNNPNWLYKLNENAQITVNLTRYGILQDQLEVNYSLNYDMLKPFKTGKIMLRKGKAILNIGTMKQAGFLECNFETTIDDVKYTHHIKVGFEPDKLTPYTPFPSDFNAFWDSTKSEAALCPLEVTREFVPKYSGEKVDCYLVRIQAFKTGNYIYGYLTIPKKKGKFPVVFSPPGAGIKPMNPLKDIFYAENGCIRFDMEIHGIRPDLDEESYKEINANYKATTGTRYYLVNGIENKETYYMRKVYISCIRAIDYLTTLPEWDGKNLIAQGSSQGGALALITTALDSRITLCEANHPALSDMMGYKAGRAGGYPHLFTKYDGMDKPDILNTLPYYDVVNFSSQIKVPVMMSWGYNDNGCPPTTSYIVYNTLKCRKEALITPNTEHWISDETRKHILKWILKNIK